MIAAVAALALNATAPLSAAAQPQQQAAAPRVPTDADRQAVLQRMGFSAAAIPLMMKEMADERADGAAAVPQLRAQGAAIVTAMNASPFDAGGFERLVRTRQTAIDTLNATVLGRRMALLRSLPPADQQLYARGLVQVRGRAGGASAPPPPAAAAPAPVVPGK